jgi:hypothetical protein
MTPTLRYPTNPVTPHGAYHILRGRIPEVNFRSWDDSCVFNMAGGLSIPDRYSAPESVRLLGLKGLVPPWQMIEQKGATQDGASFITSLYDPIEGDMRVEICGKDPERAREVLDAWIRSWDAIKPSTLSWRTKRLGYWWANVRWAKQPTEDLRMVSNKQQFTWPFRAHDGFYRSYDHVTQFKLDYVNGDDNFETDDPDDLGTGWTTALSGSGSGGVSIADGEVKSTLTGGRRIVARRNGYTAPSDNMVVEIDLGTFPTWFFASGTYVDAWVRMKNTGTPGDDGVRLRFGAHSVTLSSFNSGDETVLRFQPLIVPLKPTDKLTIVAGYAGQNVRRFQMMRNRIPLPFMNVFELGGVSQVGADFRSAGFGLQADSTNNAVSVRYFSVGEHLTRSQSGFLTLGNAGDQPLFYNYTCVGPGTFRFANGPGSTDMVEFGPLLPNQIGMVRTDPRKRGVIDLSVTPTTPQEKAAFSNILESFLSFASGNNTIPLLDVLQSIFGVFGNGPSTTPPQGNLYSLLKGRFSDAAAIPPRAPGGPFKSHSVKVEIVDGNADSTIIAAGTPLRRFPY